MKGVQERLVSASGQEPPYSRAMQAHDRIPRELAARELTASEIEEITDAVFVPPQPRPSDLLLVFGASATSGRWEAAAQLLRGGYAPRAVVTGGVPYQDGSDVSEAEGIRNALVLSGVPSSAILVEARSTNTLENVRFSIELLDAIGTRPMSLLFYCKSHHSGRVWRTLRKHLPDVPLSCDTYDASYGGATVSAADWSRSAVSVQRVLAEYERIQVYGARGDIQW